MSIMAEKYIDVLNCNDNVVVVPTVNDRCYTFQPGSLDEPCVIPIPPEEIKYMSSISRVFQNGVLRFKESQQDEMYEELGIRNPDEILFTERIEDILLHPTAETLGKLINIRDSSQFERVRAAYYRLTSQEKDVSGKVGRAINERYKELAAGKLHTEITLTVPQKQDDSSLKEQVSAMQEQLDRLTKLLAAAQAQAPAAAPVAEAVAEAPAADKPKQSRTRAKKTTKTGDA